MTRIIASRPNTVVAVLGSVLGIIVLTVGTASAQTGGVVGRVTFVGDPPPPAEATANFVNPEVCGETVQPVGLVVGPDRGVQYAVVQIVGASGSLSVPAEAPALSQDDCRFSPRVVVVGTSQPMDILNNDDILHNVHLHSEANPEKNLGQPGCLTKLSVTFEEPEIFRVGCDVHRWMSGTIVVTEHPVVAATDENGAFSLAGVPPGTYQLTVWHEQLGEQTKEITVTEGQETRSNFELAAN